MSISATNAGELRKKADQRVERGKWPAVLTGVIVVVFLLAVFLWLYPSGSVPTVTDYEGTIVDRWADNAGEAQGYQPVLRLLVESQDGQRFAIRVDPNVYESARAGMRIRSRSGQVVLVESSQPSVGK